MKTSNTITTTDGRVINAISPIIESVVNDKLNTEIKKEVDTSKIHLGILTKYYPYLDKAEVKVGKKLIVCKILHRMSGSLIDFFTPRGDYDFCETLKEPCVIPQGELDVLIADINDNTHEMLLLGYYIKDDIVYTSPAVQGHYRIADLGGTNEFGLDIGTGEINLDSVNGVTFNEGLTPSETNCVDYANSSTVYTKKEVYTKEEVDELISKAINDLKNELLEDDTDATG